MLLKRIIQRCPPFPPPSIRKYTTKVQPTNPLPGLKPYLFISCITSPYFSYEIYNEFMYVSSSWDTVKRDFNDANKIGCVTLLQFGFECLGSCFYGVIVSSAWPLLLPIAMENLYKKISKNNKKYCFWCDCEKNK